MAKVYADGNGIITRFLTTAAQESQFPDPPAGTVYTLAFDEGTNPGVIAAYTANSNGFALVGGTLTQSGTPVTINPPGLRFTDRAVIAGAVTKLFSSGGLDHLSTAEQEAIFRDHLRRSGQAPAGA